MTALGPATTVDPVDAARDAPSDAAIPARRRSLDGKRSGRGHTWLIVAALVALSLGKGMVWAVVIPFGQQPDEPAHAAYVEHLARSGDVFAPAREPSHALDVLLDASAFHTTVFRPHHIGSMDDEVIADRRRRILEIDRSDRAEPGTYQATAQGYPPLYYGAAALVFRATEGMGYLNQFISVRLLGVAISTASLVAQFFALLVLLRSRWQAALAAAFLTLMPVYSAVQTAINPETLLTLWASCGLLLLAHMARDRVADWRIHLLFGACMGAGMLTKQSIAALAVPYALVLLMAWRGGRLDFWSALRRASGAVAVGVALFGPWYVGRALALSRDPAADPGLDATFSLDVLRSYLSYMADTWSYRVNDMYWAVFGWVDVALPPVVQHAGAVLFAGTAMVIAVRAADRLLDRVAVVYAASVAGMLLLLAGIELVVYASTGQGMVQGRYLFPIAAAITGLHFWAAGSMFRARPAVVPYIMSALVLTMSIANAVALMRYIVPRYYL